MTEALDNNAAGIARAGAILRAGGLVAFGTETVYGLGGDATNANAVAGIFAAKGRPHFNPLICHSATARDAFALVIPDTRAQALAEALWPGPLTLILPRRPDCPVALLTGAGLDTLAVRVPAHKAALAVILAAGTPIAAPSANRSGRVSPTTADHVRDELAGRIDAILDCGPCAVGVESTVLDLTGPQAVLLRPGGATLDAMEAVIGPIARGTPHAVTHADHGLPSPGLMLSHYAPSLPVRLQAETVAPDEALLSFGTPLPHAGATFHLSPTQSLQAAAARLFDGLRTLDAIGRAQGLHRIAVMPVPETGLGLAINDRLRRAAAPRGNGG